MADEFQFEVAFRNKRYNDAEKGLIALGNSISNGVLTKLPPVLKTELRNYLDSVALALQQRHGNPWPGGTTASTLSRRSGKLIASIPESVRVYGGSLGDIEGLIGSAEPYARIQETGGTIYPVKAQWLTVPLPAALNSDGTPKKATAREWDNTFIIKSKAGNLIIVQKNGADLIPLYVLKKSVTIPPRMKMRETVEVGIPYFQELAVEAMVKTIQGAIANP